MMNFLTVTAIDHEMQRPLVTGQTYRVIGLDFDADTTYFYVIISSSPLEILRISEHYFLEQDFIMPEGWSFKVNPNNSSEREIMLSPLVDFDDWYDLYQKSDPTVMEILRKIFE